MRLEIENTLGIRRAEIELSPGQVVEVVGPNASGKTSLAVCAQAVLARESNPLGLSAADAKRSYPHDGAEDARVTLEGGGDAFTTWHPNRGTVDFGSSIGPLPTYNAPETVGLVDFTAKRGAKERAAVFQSALLPPMDAVLLRVKDALERQMSEADVVGVMQMLEERGWEATASVYEDRARQAKREWREITARNYGVKVASDWRPDGWLADYDLKTVQEAEANVTDARDGLSAMHRVQAVSETDQERAQEAREALPDLQRRFEELNKRHMALLDQREAIPLGTARQEVGKLEGEIAHLEFEREAGQVCPHCNQGLTVLGGKIIEAQSANALDVGINQLRAAHADALSRAANLEDQAAPMVAEFDSLGREISELEREIASTGKLALQEGEVQSEADRIALAQMEQAVEDAREVVRLVAAEADAGRLHETIVRYTEIARALGPEGVRARMLADGFKKLNAGLRVVANVSGWPLTAVADNSSITIGARPVQMCSESERWRAQAAIQLTLGAITESKAVVLDRGDLLDQANRHGLAMALQRVAEKTGMAILLCSTGNAEYGGYWPQVAIDAGQVVS